MNFIHLNTWQAESNPARETCTCSPVELSSTGLHVHVSRAGFDSACHVFKWMKFIYRNRERVTRLARRSSTQWAAFTDEDRRAVKHFAKGVQGERYRAINTGNDD